MPCTTMSSVSMPAGLAFRYGESTCRTPSRSPVAVSTLSGAASGTVMAASLTAGTGAVLRTCHNYLHEPQRRLRLARPQARVAPVHADEGPRGRAAARPDQPRQGCVALRLR